MSVNKIEIYQGNSKLIVCDVSGLTDLTGYSGYLNVKETTDGTLLVSNTGSISDMQITFSIPYTDTSLNAGDYLYDITIESSTYRYTIVQDAFKVLDSVKF